MINKHNIFWGYVYRLGAYNMQYARALVLSAACPAVQNSFTLCYTEGFSEKWWNTEYEFCFDFVYKVYMKHFLLYENWVRSDRNVNCRYCKVPLLMLLQSADIFVTAKRFIALIAKYRFCYYWKVLLFLLLQTVVIVVNTKCHSCCYCKLPLLFLLQSAVIFVTAKCLYCFYCKVPLLLLLKVPLLLLLQSYVINVTAKCRNCC